MKTCTTCEIEKSLEEFHICKSGKYGRSSTCKTCRKEYRKIYNKENREKNREYYRQYKEENKEKIKEYHKKNKIKIRKYQNEYKKERRKNDPQFRIANNLRKRTTNGIFSQGGIKSASTQELLGCTFKEARIHIENQFLPGMSWENYSEWEIDHIRPMASFDLTDPEQQKLCCHYTNLQPLWAKDNYDKSSWWNGIKY